MKTTLDYVKINAGDQMNFVFKPSDNIREKITDYYKDLCKDNKPPYTVFQAQEADTTITLYESGKVMFQGTSADIDANMWAEMEYKHNNIKIDFTKKDKKKEIKEKEEKDYSYLKFIPTIGSDEVGTGDYFGPVVVTASYVSKENIDFLKELKITDSKLYSDEQIIKLAPVLIKAIPHVSFMLNNKEYNEIKDSNLNKIKAILHNKVLLKLINENNLKNVKVVVDQFVNKKKYYEYLSSQKEKLQNILFLVKAEDKVYSVAVSSIISRYLFLKEIKKIENKLNEKIPLGAGSKVDEFAKILVEKYGEEILKEISKLNFKNTNRILS